MDVQKLSMDKDQARDLYREYQAHRANMTKDDQAIAAIYKRIAQGKLVVRALASITAAGLGADGLPKLAIMRADCEKVRCSMWTGKFSLRAEGRHYSHTAKDRVFEFAAPSLSSTRDRVASVPLIPVHLRPRTALHRYHVLWEADWNQYPVDPYLLRRFGEDAWLVVAAWDLTPIERAVMSSRLNA